MADTRLAMDIIARDNASRTLKNVAGAADGAGASFRDWADETRLVDAEITRLEGSVRRLQTEIARNPDDKALRRKLGAESRDLAFFRKIADSLKPVGVDGGRQFNAGFGEALAALPAQLKGGGLAIGAGVAGALTPAIGAAVAAAVLGGASVGGIVGGVALAAQDSRVQAAWQDMAQRAGAAFVASAETTFVGPTLAAISRVDAASQRVAGQAGQAFAAVAPSLVPLTDGLIGLVERGLPGFIGGLRNAQPVVNVLARELPKIGQAAGDFVETISEDTDGAQMAVIALSQAIQGTLQYGGDLLKFLGQWYEYTVLLGASVTQVSQLWSWVPGVGDDISGLNESFREQLAVLQDTDSSTGTLAFSMWGLADSEEAVAAAAREASGRLDDLFGKQMSVDEATIRYERGLRDLRDELTEGKRTLDEHSEAGLSNRAAVLDQLRAIEDLRVAQFNQTGDLKTANATYDQHIEQLKRTLLQLGYNRDEVEDLIAMYARIPRLVEIEIRNKIVNEGEMHPLERRAAGGPVRAGTPYLVGENGPELVTFGASGMVHNAAQTAAMLSSGGAFPGGPQQVEVVLHIRGDDDDLVARIRKNVEVLGGGNVQLTFGSGS